MNSILNRNLFFVKEHVGLLKAANNYDIYDPETNELIINCREEKLSFITKVFRFTNYKRMTPFYIELKGIDGEKILSVRRGISIFLSSVKVFDENDVLVGCFKQKLFSIGGSFKVLDINNQKVFILKGSWTGWNFRFLRNEKELASVNKKWAGIGQEMFTSADNYMLNIANTVPVNSPNRLLIMGAVMCIDMVHKE